MKYIKKGFTLVEMAVVLSIIAVIISASMITYTTMTANVKTTENLNLISMYKEAVLNYIKMYEMLPLNEQEIKTLPPLKAGASFKLLPLTISGATLPRQVAYSSQKNICNYLNNAIVYDSGKSIYQPLYTLTYKESNSAAPVTETINIYEIRSWIGCLPQNNIVSRGSPEILTNSLPAYIPGERYRFNISWEFPYTIYINTIIDAVISNAPVKVCIEVDSDIVNFFENTNAYFTTKCTPTMLQDYARIATRTPVAINTKPPFTPWPDTPTRTRKMKIYIVSRSNINNVTTKEFIIKYAPGR